MLAAELARCLQVLGPLVAPITFSRIVLQGREGFDAQAARLPSGDVLLRVSHAPTTGAMYTPEVEHALRVLAF